MPWSEKGVIARNLTLRCDKDSPIVGSDSMASKREDIREHIVSYDASTSKKSDIAGIVTSGCDMDSYIVGYDVVATKQKVIVVILMLRCDMDRRAS